MASLMSPPYFSVGAGLTPADGSKLYFYVVGSATPKDTYTTAAATVAHANPVIADSKGVFDAIYLSGDCEWVLKDKNDVQRNSGSVSEFATVSSSVFEKTFATVAAAVADTGLVDGDVLDISEHSTGNGGGGTWKAVLSSTVTENTFDIVQCTGVGTLSLVLRVSGLVNVKQLGARGDGTTDDTLAIQAAINISSNPSVFLPDGTYRITATITLRAGLNMYGRTKNSVIIDGETDGVRVIFIAAQNTETALTQSTNLNQGDTAHTIVNTCVAGDVIRFKSTQRFTRTWDGGTEVRPTYLDGECLIVESATTSVVTLATQPMLDFPLASTDEVSFFTPREGLYISGMTIKTLQDTTSYSIGISVTGFNNIRIKDVVVENANEAGITLNKCFYFIIDGCSFVGGSDALGLDYGIVVNDGCKYGTITNVEGTQCRHVVSGGGSGYAICMFITIENGRGYGNYTYDFDAHGNTAYWTYKNIQGVVGASGIGHTVENVRSVEPVTSFLAYDGGDRCAWRNIIYENSLGLANNRTLINSTIEDFSITVVSPTSLAIGPGTNNKWRNLRIVNGAYVNTMNGTAADATLGASAFQGMTMGSNCEVDGLYIEGFPVGIVIPAQAVVKNVHFHNVGWITSFTTEPTLVKMNLDASGSVVRDIRITCDNAVISLLNRQFRLSPEVSNGGDGLHIIIDRVYDQSINPYYYGWLIDPLYNWLTITNTYVKGINSGTVGANGFSSNNNAAI